MKISDPVIWWSVREGRWWIGGSHWCRCYSLLLSPKPRSSQSNTWYLDSKPCVVNKKAHLSVCLIICRHDVSTAMSQHQLRSSTVDSCHVLTSPASPRPAGQLGSIIMTEINYKIFITVYHLSSTCWCWADALVIITQTILCHPSLSSPTPSFRHISLF